MKEPRPVLLGNIMRLERVRAIPGERGLGEIDEEPFVQCLFSDKDHGREGRVREVGRGRAFEARWGRVQELRWGLSGSDSLDEGRLLGLRLGVGWRRLMWVRCVPYVRGRAWVRIIGAGFLGRVFRHRSIVCLGD